MTPLMFLILLPLLMANAETPAASGHIFKPVIEFGHEGGNLRPYRIGIDAAGRVKVMKGKPQLKAQSISKERVQELLHKATDDSFWKPATETGAERPSLPDFGFVFVRVHVSGRNVIEHHGARAGPLGEFYSILSDLVLVNR